MFYFNYITTNKINGKQYVGAHQTNNLNDGYLGGGKLIKQAIKKYGKENFERKIINENDTIKQAYENEKFLIEVFETLIPNGYNISPTGGSQIPSCLSEETKEKLRKPRSEETKQKISKAHTGKKLSKEHRQALSEAKIGKKQSKEQIENRVKLNTGQRRSEETKQKMREACLGRKYSEEAKQKMKQGKTGNHTKELRWIYKNNQGKRIKKEKLPEYLETGYKVGRRPFSEEAKQNMKNPRSEEHKQRISKTQKGRIPICKNNQEKRIKEEELQSYLNNGWERGLTEKHKANFRKKRSKETRQKISKTQKGRIRIHKNNKIKRIRKNELQNYLNEGWKTSRNKKIK